MPYVVAAAGISAATSIGTGIMSADAAKNAASQQSASAGRALDFERQVYGTGEQNLNPYIDKGHNALDALSQLYGFGGNGNALAAYKQFQQTPFYTFPFQQGQQALDRSGAARGLTLSGGQANAIQKYGQDYGSTNFGNYISALSGLANMGSGASSSLLGQGNTNAQLQAGSNAFQGNALAQGTINSQSALNNMLSQLGGANSNSGSSYRDIGNALKGLFSSGGGSYSSVDPTGQSIAPTPEGGW